jgi:hypothetical protein
VVISDALIDDAAAVLEEALSTLPGSTDEHEPVPAS